jgi:hypothetical protein
MAVFGDSLRSIRLIPALSSAALIILTGMMARKLGGKRFAVAFSAVTILVAPIYLSGGSLLTSNRDSLRSRLRFRSTFAAARNSARWQISGPK